MHPPLYRPHPLCEAAVDLLVSCHRQHPLLKFGGACNELKASLDRCFKAEKEAMRDAQRRQQSRDGRVSKLEGLSGQEDQDFLQWYGQDRDRS